MRMLTALWDWPWGECVPTQKCMEETWDLEAAAVLVRRVEGRGAGVDPEWGSSSICCRVYRRRV